jgi:hypothetical protein
LRSFAAVKVYHVHASDGSIGHVADFLVDDVAWDIRYLVIDTNNWVLRCLSCLVTILRWQLHVEFSSD